MTAPFCKPFRVSPTALHSLALSWLSPDEVPCPCFLPHGPMGKIDGRPLRCYPTLVEPWSCWASLIHSPSYFLLLKTHIRPGCSEGLLNGWIDTELLARSLTESVEGQGYLGFCLLVVGSLGAIFNNALQDLTSQPIRELLCLPTLPGASMHCFLGIPGDDQLCLIPLMNHISSWSGFS